MATPKTKNNYKLAFRLSVLVNLMLLLMGLVFLINSSVEAAPKLSSIGSNSYNLNMGKNDIIYVYCPRNEPNLGYLSNQMALTCP